MKLVRIVLGIPFLLLGMAIGLVGVALVTLGLNIQGESFIKVGKSK